MMSANAKAHSAFSGYDLDEATALNRVRRLYAKGAEWWQEHRAYNQTINELSALSDRDLSDIGISRADIPSIARQTSKSARPSH
jgi:uncharacterized protein YjiS (DUF1127 family)